MFKLAPSILSADFSKLGSDVEKISLAGCDYVHIDVMDGMYVPNITFGPMVIAAIRPYSTKVFDVHLMIEEPVRYVEAFAKAGADLITVHYEATKHLHRTLQAIRQTGVKVGVSINPATPLCVLEPILDDVDMILLMTVNPGFGGQAFIPYSIEKIKALKEMLQHRKLNIDIQVDGGITLENVQEVVRAGANVVVAGSAVFNASNIEETITTFKKLGSEAL